MRRYEVLVKWEMTGYVYVDAQDSDHARSRVGKMNNGDGPNWANAEDLHTDFYEIANIDCVLEPKPRKAGKRS